MATAIHQTYGDEWLHPRDISSVDYCAFNCPKCNQLIYKDDFPLVDMHDDGRYECPICKSLL